VLSDSSHLHNHIVVDLSFAVEVLLDLSRAATENYRRIVDAAIETFIAHSSQHLPCMFLRSSLFVNRHLRVLHKSPPGMFDLNDKAASHGILSDG
jgi:hypothetical protein